jgi:hypothetical protein
MGELGDAVSYTVIALGFVVLIFLGALFFVQASRRGNRRFKWWRRGDVSAPPPGPERRER